MERHLNTLHDVLRAFADHGDRPAVIALRREGTQQWSFAKLADTVGRLAGGFREAGLEPGARAALIAPNRAEWIAACLALLEAKAIPVLVDAQSDAESLGRMLEDSQARWVFTSRHLVDAIPQPEGGRPRRTVLLDAEDDDQRRWQALLASEPLESGAPEPDDLAALFYTSGTSGAAKGVPLSHRNLGSNVRALLDLDVIDPDERALLPLPLHHVYPFTVGMLLPLAAGVPIVLPFSLTGPQIVRALAETGTTAVFGVPRLYSALLSAVEGEVAERGRAAGWLFRNLLAACAGMPRSVGSPLGRLLLAPVRRRLGPKVRKVVSGGSPIDAQLARKLQGLGWQFTSGYGLTETSPVLTFNAPGHARIGTAGKVLSGVELRVAEPRENYEHGEVEVAGPNVFAGYWNLPEKTEEAFTDDGFFRTGDLGQIDDDGYLHLHGRASSLIVLPGGENIRPGHVEEVLQRSPAVREAGVLEADGRLAAVVVPDARWSQRIEPDQLQQRLRDEVERVSGELPSHHRVAELAVSRESLARTRLGKIRRHRLAERFDRLQHGEESGERPGPIPVSEMSPEAQALLEEPAAQAAWDALAERFQNVRLTPATRLQTDLGVDSLEWIDLGLEIRRRTGRELDESAVERIETVADLLREVNEAQESKEDAASERLRGLEDPEAALDDDQRQWLRPRWGPTAALGETGFWLNRRLLRMLMDLTTEGLEHAEVTEPVVFVPNHRSYLDAPTLAAALPPEVLRNTYWGGATEVMFQGPASRLVSRAARVIPVETARVSTVSLAMAAAIVRRRQHLVWFAEGAISRDGRLQSFHPGIGMLLESRPVPVVPVFLEGTAEALPFGSWRPRLRRLKVRFGEPLRPEDYPQAEGEDRPQAIADTIRERIATLGDSQRG